MLLLLRLCLRLPHIRCLLVLQLLLLRLLLGTLLLSLHHVYGMLLRRLLLCMLCVLRHPHLVVVLLLLLLRHGGRCIGSLHANARRHCRVRRVRWRRCRHTARPPWWVRVWRSRAICGGCSICAPCRVVSSCCQSRCGGRRGGRRGAAAMWRRRPWLLLRRSLAAALWRGQRRRRGVSLGGAPRHFILVAGRRVRRQRGRPKLILLKIFLHRHPALICRAGQGRRAQGRAEQRQGRGRVGGAGMGEGKEGKQG